jgi:hypothetical protein
VLPKTAAGRRGLTDCPFIPSPSRFGSRQRVYPLPKIGG